MNDRDCDVVARKVLETIFDRDRLTPDAAGGLWGEPWFSGSVGLGADDLAFGAVGVMDKELSALISGFNEYFLEYQGLADDV